MRLFNLVRFILLSALFASLGCAALPPEAVISQRKVSVGLEAARNNQLLVINNFAEEAKSRLQLSFQLGIPEALKEEYGERDSYSPQEVKDALVGYGKHLQADLKKIDDKRKDLIIETNQFFNDLSMLSNVNLELLESAVKLNAKYKAIFDGIVSKDDTFGQIIGRE